MFFNRKLARALARDDKRRTSECRWVCNHMWKQRFVFEGECHAFYDGGWWLGWVVWFATLDCIVLLLLFKPMPECLEWLLSRVNVSKTHTQFVGFEPLWRCACWLLAQAISTTCVFLLCVWQTGFGRVQPSALYACHFLFSSLTLVSVRFGR